MVGFVLAQDEILATHNHRDTPDNTGKTPDQQPQRLNNKLRHSTIGSGHYHRSRRDLLHLGHDHTVRFPVTTGHASTDRTGDVHPGFRPGPRSRRLVHRAFERRVIAGWRRPGALPRRPAVPPRESDPTPARTAGRTRGPGPSSLLPSSGSIALSQPCRSAWPILSRSNIRLGPDLGFQLRPWRWAWDHRG